jgi:hypothetical protein
MTLSSFDQAQRWLSLKLGLNQRQSQLEDNMKFRMVLLGSGVIMAIMLLVSPAWAQVIPQPMGMVATSTVDTPPALSTATQLTTTLPVQFDRNSDMTAPMGGGGGIAPYHTTRQRLSENTINDYAPVVAYNPKRDEYLVVWSECPTNEVCNVVGRRTTGQGVPIGPTFAIATGYNDRLPAVGYNSYHGEYLVTYARYNTATTTSDLYGHIILGNGTLWGSELTVDAGASVQTWPRVAFNPTAINHGHPGEYLVVYQSGDTIVAKHVGSYGDIDASAHPLGVFPDLTTPDVAYNPARNEYLVAFAQIISNTPSIHNSDIYARRIDATGDPLGSQTYIAVGTLDATSPHIAVGADTYLIAYTFGPNNMSDAATISGSWLTSEGNLINNYPTLIADPPPNSLKWPTVACTGQGFLVTWQSVNGVEAVNTNGRYLRLTPGFWSDVFTIDNATYDQYNGAVACTTGSCLIVDTDNWYDSGQDYEITAWTIWLQQVFLPLVIR